MAVTKQKVRRSFFRIYTVKGVVLSILASLNSPATLPSAPDAGRTLKINCPFKGGGGTFLEDWVAIRFGSAQSLLTG